MKCDLKEHYARQCKTKPKGKEKVQFAAKDHSAEEENTEDDYVFTIDQNDSTTETQIGGVSVAVVINSGASSNILSETQWENLKAKGVHCRTTEQKQTSACRVE